MSAVQRELYREIINGLKTALIDLENCFADKDAVRALAEAIDLVKPDLAEQNLTNS